MASDKTIDLARRAMWDACDSIITKGIETALEVAKSIWLVNKDELWREAGYTNFIDCCDQRWKIKKSHAYRMLEAGKTSDNIEKNSPIGEKPTHESQVRPLTKLPQTEQAQAWADAVASSPTGKPTAKEVEQVVQERINKPTQEPRFVCRHCYGNELTDDGEYCARCKEPVTLPEHKPRFAVAAARKKLFRALDDLMATWPEDQHAAFCDACLDYANERKDSSQ